MATGSGTARLRRDLRPPFAWAICSPPCQATEALPSGITLDNATFDEAKAVWAVAAAESDGAELAEIEGRAQTFLASPLVVEVAHQRWTTTELLALEERVVAIALGSRAGGYGAADRSSVDDALRARPSLSDDQLAMVRRIATSGDQIDVVVGAPGSGKTFALDAASLALGAGPESGIERGPVLHDEGCGAAAEGHRELIEEAGLAEDHRKRRLPVPGEADVRSP